MASVLCQQRQLRMDSGVVIWWVIYYDPGTTIAAEAAVHPTNSLLWCLPRQKGTQKFWRMYLYIYNYRTEQGKCYDRHRVAYPDSSARKDLLLGYGGCKKKSTSSCQLLGSRPVTESRLTPRSCLSQGSLHLLNERDGCIIQGVGKNTQSRALHQVGRGFVGPAMDVNFFLCPILLFLLPFIGIAF